MDRPADLPDVGVWLALTLPDHPHHGRVRRYWYEEASPELAFCRVTALAFLRLATHPTAMGGEPLSVPLAWRAYTALRRLPEVVLAPEPEGCERLLAAWATGGEASPRGWTGAYLAAFARAGGFRLVSFDPGFGRYEGLDLLRLEG